MKNVLLFLMAFLFECQIVAQEVTIRGSVADAADITDVEGKFSLKIPKGTLKLSFSCVGYQEQEVALKSNQTVLNVSMREDSELLDEVVIYGVDGDYYGACSSY